MPLASRRIQGRTSLTLGAGGSGNARQALARHLQPSPRGTKGPSRRPAARTGKRAEPGRVLKGRSVHMGLFSSSTALNSFDDLMVEQLQDLYDAEQRLVKALPRMAAAAHNNSLKAAFQDHLRQTEGHVSRLEQVFKALGKPAEAKTCVAMKGLIEEGEEAVNAK